MSPKLSVLTSFRGTVTCVCCLLPPKGQDRAWAGMKTRRASPTEVSPYELGRERFYPGVPRLRDLPLLLEDDVYVARIAN